MICCAFRKYGPVVPLPWKLPRRVSARVTDATLVSFIPFLFKSREK